MKRSKLNPIVNIAVKVKALEQNQRKSFKEDKIKQQNLEMQDYLKPYDLKITKENAVTIFKLKGVFTIQ